MLLKIEITNYDPKTLDLDLFKRHLWEYIGEIGMCDINITLKKDVIGRAKCKKGEDDKN